jgi:hypothetical protein
MKSSQNCVAACVALLMLSCVGIGVHSVLYRPGMTSANFERIRQGETTRDEVERILGRKPDQRWGDASCWFDARDEHGVPAAYIIIDWDGDRVDRAYPWIRPDRRRSDGIWENLCHLVLQLDVRAGKG